MIKIPLIRKFNLNFFIVTRVVASMLLILVNLTGTLLQAAGHMDTSNLTGKIFKNGKESAVSDKLLQSDYTIYFDHFHI